MTVQAVDYRGKHKGQAVPGKARRSDKWVFEVTDQQSVRDAMENRFAEQMDRKLDEVLRAQLEAGK